MEHLSLAEALNQDDRTGGRHLSWLYGRSICHTGRRGLLPATYHFGLPLVLYRYGLNYERTTTLNEPRSPLDHIDARGAPGSDKLTHNELRNLPTDTKTQVPQMIN